MSKIKKLIKKCSALISSILNIVLFPFNLEVVRKNANKDFVLHKYHSYEIYKKIQIEHNIRKLTKVWSDEKTLDRVAEKALALRATGTINGLCHGTRNGYEQGYLTSKYKRIKAIGTDISESAREFPLSFVWDFHDQNDDWTGSFDFVYSNSLDQSWNPKKALTTWLGQVCPREGIVIIELTLNHGPEGASKMDPFGVRPRAFPYVLSEWFGEQIKLSHSVEKKTNMELDAWLFFISNVIN